MLKFKNRYGKEYEVNSHKKNLTHYKKVVKKGATRKDGKPYSDIYRGKAMGYIESCADGAKLNKKREAWKAKQAKSGQPQKKGK